jgi:hypothetical protein
MPLNKELCKDRVVSLAGKVRCVNPDRDPHLLVDCTNCLCYSFSGNKHTDGFFKVREKFQQKVVDIPS